MGAIGSQIVIVMVGHHNDEHWFCMSFSSLATALLALLAMIEQLATCSRFSQIIWQCDGAASSMKQLFSCDLQWEETKAGIEDFEYALQATGWGSLWFSIWQ